MRSEAADVNKAWSIGGERRRPACRLDLNRRRCDAICILCAEMPVHRERCETGWGSVVDDVGGSVRAREAEIGNFRPLVSNPEGVYPPRRRQHFGVSVPELGTLPTRGGASPIRFATAGETSDRVGDER